MRLIDADELIEIIEGSEELLDFQKEELLVCVDACCVIRDRYNKAIDDVIKSIDDICDTERDRCNDFGRCSDCYKSGIKEMAEQLKR